MLSNEEEHALDLAIGRIERGWTQGRVGLWMRNDSVVCLVGGFAYGWHRAYHQGKWIGANSVALRSPIWKQIDDWFKARYECPAISYNDSLAKSSEDVVLELKKFKAFQQEEHSSDDPFELAREMRKA